MYNLCENLISFVRFAVSLLALGIMTLAITACGGGPSPESLALAKQPVTKDKARIEFRRKSTLLYAGASATIKINNKKVASLGSGGTRIVDVKPGKTTISADAWSYPGKFTISLTPKAGAHYIIEVAPREASLGPSILLGPIGGMIDANVNENAGAFQLKLISGGKKQAAKSATRDPENSERLAVNMSKRNSTRWTMGRETSENT